MRRLFTTLALVAGIAVAGSAAGAPFGPGHGQGHHGMGGLDGPMAGPAMMFGPQMEAIKGQLNLTPPQQAQWTAAVEQSRRAMETMRETRQQTRDAVSAELAKPELDLVRLAGIRDNAEQTMRNARIAARDAWLQLYSSFSSEQKATVKQAIEQRLERRRGPRAGVGHRSHSG